MTTVAITPLRQKDTTGKPYTRFPHIEAKLVEISALTREQIAARCAVGDRESADYLPSECLLYLIREHRSNAFDDCSETLFKTLMERVLRGLPQGESCDGTRERMTDCNVRDEGRHRFVEMLARDRQEYVERLDFYEVRFEMALSMLRVDAQRKVYRKDDPIQSIEDEDTGEVAEHVERAAGSFNPFDSHFNEDDLLRLDEAIAELPDLQKAIVVMIRNGIPIESKEPGIVNIATTLGKTPKTIRTHRDNAYATCTRH